MTIASEITALNTNLTAAKDAVTAKGGTVGDTGLAGLAAEIASIPAGGGATRPTTWAQFAAMSTTDMQKVYGVGDRVGIACPWVSSSNGTTYSDLIWEIVGWGTTKKENDNTSYPCVTLMARLTTNGTYNFDTKEEPVAATEATAQADIYYFGYDGSTYTALNLSAGDTIPYGSYTAVYKSDVTNNASYYANILSYGYNIYKYSSVRQWLNSDGAANSWWQASHIGDASPNYANQPGFMNGLDSSFKAILQPTETVTAGNGATIPTNTSVVSYDYLFLPSRYEIYSASTPVEGDRMPYFAENNANVRGLVPRGPVSASNVGSYWMRSPLANNVGSIYYADSTGKTTSNQTAGNMAYYVAPACKIILPS